MDANSLLMNRFKMQCNKFSGTISKGLGIIKKRLVKEMIYGIQASKDVKLSNINNIMRDCRVDLLLLITCLDKRKECRRISMNIDDQDGTKIVPRLTRPR